MYLGAESQVTALKTISAKGMELPMFGRELVIC